MLIFLDMDGVLCNWVEQMCATLDLPYEEVIKNWEKGADNLRDGASLEMSASEQWSAVDSAGEDFWATMKHYPWTDDLWDLCEDQCDEMIILSSPSKHHSSLAGKLRWLQAYKGEWFRGFLIGPPKHAAARWDRVLIDDKNKNVESFRKNGGKAILFPQPWNSLSSILTIEGNRMRYVEDMLKKVKEEIEQERDFRKSLAK